MTFGELKAYVTDVLGRSDIPTAAYAAAQDDWNRKLHLQDDQVSVTLSSPYTLPANFVSFVEVNSADGSTLEGYRVTGNAMEMFPETTEDIEVIYIANGANLVNAGDTNSVLTKYAQVAIYGTLYHTCVMLRDSEGMAAFGQVYATAIGDALKADQKARFYGSPMIPTPRDAA